MIMFDTMYRYRCISIIKVSIYILSLFINRQISIYGSGALINELMISHRYAISDLPVLVIKCELRCQSIGKNIIHHSRYSNVVVNITNTC